MNDFLCHSAHVVITVEEDSIVLLQLLGDSGTVEVETLLGDPTKAKSVLGWNPTKTSFPELVKIMMEHDMEYVKNERTVRAR